jgi:hypothetical protein
MTTITAVCAVIEKFPVSKRALLLSTTSQLGLGKQLQLQRLQPAGVFSVAGIRRPAVEGRVGNENLRLAAAYYY